MTKIICDVCRRQNPPKETIAKYRVESDIGGEDICDEHFTQAVKARADAAGRDDVRVHTL